MKVEEKLAVLMCKRDHNDPFDWYDEYIERCPVGEPYKRFYWEDYLEKAQDVLDRLEKLEIPHGPF